MNNIGTLSAGQRHACPGEPCDYLFGDSGHPGPCGERRLSGVKWAGPDGRESCRMSYMWTGRTISALWRRLRPVCRQGRQRAESILFSAVKDKDYEEDDILSLQPERSGGSLCGHADPRTDGLPMRKSWAGCSGRHTDKPVMVITRICRKRFGYALAAPERAPECAAWDRCTWRG